MRQFIDAIEKYGEARVAALLDDAGAQSSQEKIKERQNLLKTRAARQKTPLRQALIDSIHHSLATASSREEGLKRLRNEGLTRRELENLARKFDVPVRKDQKINDLEELIINVTIGARLNSEAIRNG
ncbi:hypothetical protein [uncultured Sphingomonas sp.]|uniref:hypothetical protein n=1 Tax=uncultured Sphingomonas sp. TaxID=158754 RepID=UPI0037480FB8